jgi:hypothetical protein
MPFSPTSTSKISPFTTKGPWKIKPIQKTTRITPTSEEETPSVKFIPIIPALILISPATIKRKTKMNTNLTSFSAEEE